ncbi:MAG: hypothetical protein WA426_04020 [Silvibacterium sp.]
MSGRMDAEDTTVLKKLLGDEPEGVLIVVDLKDLTLVDRDAVRFLKRCEADDIRLRNVPAYIRQWIEREREVRRTTV